METAISNGDNGTIRPLFGGAFSCFIPNNSLDASSVREVPDNQEVFCHTDNDQSIMVSFPAVVRECYFGPLKGKAPIR